MTMIQTSAAINTKPATSILCSQNGLVSREQLETLPAPEGTDTWFPVAHRSVLEMAEDAISDAGFTINRTRLAVANEGQRFFGTLDLASGIDEGVTLAVGVRNSTDKSFAAQLVLGNRVFVCDNLCFSGQVKISRKHTRYVERDFRGLICEGIGRLTQFQASERQRITRMKRVHLGHADADRVMLKAVRKGVIGVGLLKPLMAEWDAPSYEEFEPRTAWSLLNCLTHVLKERQGKQPAKAARETMRFQRLLVG